MENNYEGYLKLPDFEFADVVRKKADDINLNFFSNGLYRDKRELNRIENVINELTCKEDKIFFLSLTINFLSDLNYKFIKKNKNFPYREVEENQAFLYYLYGKLKECGIDVRNDLFSPEEIQSNTEKIDFIIKELKKLEPNEQIEEIIQELELIKPLQVLGKKNFLRQLGGVFYKKTQDKIIDKILDLGIELVIKGIPHLLNLIQ